MSRVFLLSSNTMTEPYPVYPLGMAIVASALVSAGHQVQQFDFLAEGRNYNRLHQAIQEFNPDFVGVSMRNIDNVDSFTSEESWALALDKEIIKRIRGATGAPVVLGGSAFSLMPEEILEFVGADYGIIGDGGILFTHWLECFEQGQKIPLISRENHPLDLGDMTVPPLWNESIINYYKESSKVIGLRTKRGCPHHCAYCTYPALEGSKVRHREPGSVIEDIRRLQKDYHIETIFFTDSVFNDDEETYLEMVEELIRSEIRMPWSAFFQPIGIENKHLRRLKRSGLYAAESGTDASSDATLEGLNKGFCFDDVVHFNEICLNQEIPCAHYIMFGGPGETRGTVKDGLDNIELLKNCVVLAFSGVRLLPGTLLYWKAVKEGIVQEEDSLLKPVFYFSPDIEPETMNKTLAEAFKHQRQRIFPPSACQEKLKLLRRFGYRGPLWETLISFNKAQLRK